MQNAIESVVGGEFGYQNVSQSYVISKSMLQDRVNKFRSYCNLVAATSKGFGALIFTTSNRGNPALQKDLIFTKSNRGNPALQIGKYKFNLKIDKKRNNCGPTRRWVCNLRNRGCRAFIVTIDHEIITCRNEHNH
ncbi:FLYWCH zinc finger domain-containing protein [Phthorimaea operculella]|nr:FLYWCH zinc finger domain-containing protein [Phthorimaea operculella]